jgi:hypothetical protein
MKTGPKILLFDIETAPIIGYVWELWDQNVALNQIKSDWHLLSWSAKWLGDAPTKVMYDDQRHERNIENDKRLLKGIWRLLDEADIVVTQNGKQFDQKRLNARFVINGLRPPSSFKHIDTLVLAKKHFAFTSNKLEYMSDKLCKKYKKLKHTKFPGFEMWRECLAGNKAAWNEMRKYNKYDVLALEELYTKLIPFDSSVNFNLYHDGERHTCSCGSTRFQKYGFSYTQAGKYQRYQCFDCGTEIRGRDNLLSAKKRKSLRVGTVR